jgi:hypothetical protein
MFIAMFRQIQSETAVACLKILRGFPRCWKRPRISPHRPTTHPAISTTWNSQRDPTHRMETTFTLEIAVTPNKLPTSQSGFSLTVPLKPANSARRR